MDFVIDTTLNLDGPSHKQRLASQRLRARWADEDQRLALRVAQLRGWDRKRRNDG